MPSNNSTLQKLYAEAERLLRKANRNVGRAWRVIEDAKLHLKRSSK